MNSIVVYGASFMLSLLASFLYSNTRKDEQDKTNYLKQTIWVILIILPIIFISTYRYDVGTDFFNYQYIYNEVELLSLGSLLTTYRHSNEPLFIITTKLSSVLFGNFQSFLFVTSFITYFLIVKTFMFFKNNFSMTFGLFISYMIHFSIGLNIIRQMIALSIVFYSFIYLYKKSFFKYALLIIIATLFHNSAIIAIIFFLFVNWDINIYGKKIKNYIIFIYLLLIAVSPLIIYLLLSIITSIPFLQNYSHFINEGFDFGFGAFILILPFFIPIFIYRNEIKKKFNSFTPFLYLSLLNIPLSFLGYYGVIIGRLAYYGELFFYIMIPVTIGSISNKNDRYIIIIYYIALLLSYYIYNFIILGNAGAYPYIFTF